MKSIKRIVTLLSTRGTTGIFEYIVCIIHQRHHLYFKISSVALSTRGATGWLWFSLKFNVTTLFSSPYLIVQQRSRIWSWERPSQLPRAFLGNNTTLLGIRWPRQGKHWNASLALWNTGLIKNHSGRYGVSEDEGGSDAGVSSVIFSFSAACDYEAVHRR